MYQQEEIIEGGKKASRSKQTVFVETDEWIQRGEDSSHF